MSFLLNFPGNADAVRFDAGQVDHLQPVFGYPYGFEPSPSHVPMKARTLAKHHSIVIVSVHDPRQDVEEDSRSLYDWSRSRKQEQEQEQEAEIRNQEGELMELYFDQEKLAIKSRICRMVRPVDPDDQESVRGFGVTQAEEPT